VKIFNLFGILGNNLKRNSIIIIILLFIGSILEMLGIGLIFPLLSIITNTGNQNKYTEYLNFIFQLDDPSQSQLIFHICILILLIFIFKNIFLLSINFLQLKFVKKFQQLLGIKLLNNYLDQSINYFSDKNSSLFIRNISNDLTLLSTSLINFALAIMESLILFFIFIFLFIINIKITIVLILIFLLFLFIYLSFTKKRIAAWAKIRQNTESQKIKVVKEALIFIREISIYRLKKHFLGLFDNSNTIFANTMLKHTFVQNSVKLVLEVIGVTSILIMVIISNIEGQPSEFIPLIGLFAGAAFKILPSINRIINAYQQINFIKPIIKTFYNELKLKNFKNINEDNELLNFEFNKNIQFKDIYFSHLDNKFIFKKFNLEIKKGSFVVITGGSGVGKSTLLDLLVGFQIPNHGSILIDDHKDIKKFLKEWRSIIGYAPQNNIILDMSCIENIAIGKINEIDQKKIEEAIQISELDDVIKDLPESLNTHLGESGNKLSGGQKQRIGIARTIYNDREILLFDEATNALDKKTNIKILKNLKNYSKKFNKTIIFITHNYEAEEFGDKVINLSEQKR
jgi:ATP-binding cassette, subfamily B, bacterial PglK